jgi:ribosomal protein S27AE
MNKRCSKCGEEKDLTEFYADRQRRDGHSHMCKVCKRKVAREHMRKPEMRARENARYAASAELRAKKQERKAASYRADPTKASLRALAAYAVRKGRLVEPGTCEVCGSSGPLERHHDDYTKPLEVRWLCVVCHHKLSRVE